jgi:Domain of unknown function (DUF4431)
MRGATVVAIMFVALVGIRSAGATCLSYAGRVFVSGILKRAVSPGPPHYTSIARGDAPEIYYVLEFQPPACVDADPTDNEKPPIKKLRQMQLVLSHPQYVELEPWLDRPIRLSGVLFEAHTGHHHTPVLLNDVQFDSR